MKDTFEIHDEDAEVMLSELGSMLKDSMPEGWGFTLMMYTYEKGATFYVSSGRREDVIQMLKEFIDRQESENDPTKTRRK